MRPRRDVRVSVHGDVTGRSLVRVHAADDVGLLAGICRWFAEQGTSIESLHARTTSSGADDALLVTAPCDGPDLHRYLSRYG